MVPSSLSGFIVSVMAFRYVVRGRDRPRCHENFILCWVTSYGTYAVLQYSVIHCQKKIGKMSSYTVIVVKSTWRIIRVREWLYGGPQRGDVIFQNDA